jgi:hypothetical protein
MAPETYEAGDDAAVLRIFLTYVQAQSTNVSDNLRVIR